jgi:hypothetical protein
MKWNQSCSVSDTHALFHFDVLVRCNSQNFWAEALFTSEWVCDSGDMEPTSGASNPMSQSQVPTAMAVIDLTMPELLIDLTESTQVQRYNTALETAPALTEELIDLLPNDCYEFGEGLVCVVAPGESKYGDIVRAWETKMGWGDMPTYMNGYEHASVFTLFIDKDPTGRAELVHCIRQLQGSRLGPESSGSQVIDSASFAITADEVRSFYGIDDLHTCWDTTSSVSLNKRGVKRVPYGLLFLRLGLDYMYAHGAPKSFNWINPLTLKSIRRMGFAPDLLCEREIQAPLVDGYEYNERFIAGAQDTVTTRSAILSTHHREGSLAAKVRDWPLSIVSLDHTIISTDLARPLTT